MEKLDYRFNIDPYTLINMLDSQMLRKDIGCTYERIKKIN